MGSDACGDIAADAAEVSGGVIAGIIMAILASTASNLGVNVQKYSFLKEAAERPGQERPYVRQYRWWIGLGLVIFGAIGDFVAFALAPQTIVTPVGSFTLVTNVFFAHFWLGEELHTMDIIGTVLIVVGATVAVIFGDKSEKCYTLKRLLELYTNAGMVVYAILVVATLCTMYYVVKRSEKLLKDADYTPFEEPESPPAPVNERLRALSNSSSGPGLPRITSGQQLELQLVTKEDSLQAARSTAASTTSSSRRSRIPAAYEKFAKLHPLCYAGLAGTFGAQTVSLAKSTAEILKTTFNGDNQFRFFFSYVILLCMFMTIFLEQHWLATGLKYFDALYVVPVFQSFFIGVSVVGGAVYFQELSNFSLKQFIMFPLGVLMCLAGVLLLSMRSMVDGDIEGDLPAAPDAADTFTSAGKPVTISEYSEDGQDVYGGSVGGSAAPTIGGSVAGSVETGSLIAAGDDAAGSVGSGSAAAGAGRPRRGSHSSAGSDATATSVRSAVSLDPTVRQFMASMLPTGMGGQRRRSLLKGDDSAAIRAAEAAAANVALANAAAAAAASPEHGGKVEDFEDIEAGVSTAGSAVTSPRGPSATPPKRRRRVSDDASAMTSSERRRLQNRDRMMRQHTFRSAMAKGQRRGSLGLGLFDDLSAANIASAGDSGAGEEGAEEPDAMTRTGRRLSHMLASLVGGMGAPAQYVNSRAFDRAYATAVADRGNQSTRGGSTTARRTRASTHSGVTLDLPTSPRGSPPALNRGSGSGSGSGRARPPSVSDVALPTIPQALAHSSVPPTPVVEEGEVEESEVADSGDADVEAAEVAAAAADSDVEASGGEPDVDSDRSTNPLADQTPE